VRVLVHGLAIAGAATVRALLARGHQVVVTDDRRSEASQELAAALGVELGATPADLDAFVTEFDEIVPAPGVPETHPLVLTALRHGVPLASEIELAGRWEAERPGGPRPILAVTGTDGKTTTTLMAAAMLEAGGRRTVASGNTDVPFVDAIDLPLDAHVVECTSFRLAWTHTFRADAAVWLNLAPDHLNWHRSMDTYEAAKARIFELQHADDVAIGSIADPIVMRHLAVAPARRITFGASGADYHVEGGWLTGPRGRIAEVASMRRSLPHDRTNALAAAAMVLETGLVDEDAVAEALATFTGPPHRIEPLGEFGGIAWYDDSKATTPHAASVAVRAFDRVVLIAGGRNKGLDLSPLAGDLDRVVGVVAIGEAAEEVATVFAGRRPLRRAASMAEAVAAAADLAAPGDVVLLSPGCASFDWYPDGGYPARGADFRHHVHLLAEGGTP
jgi:UDP-N-acetylmuramoylalanine--D-glutamate ligase